MATYKRVDGDYVITTINSQDFVRVNTHTMEINGNLNVRGNLTYIEVTELKVDDPFIVVAANNSGTMANAVFQNQGLVTQTSSNTFAGLRFNNANDRWEVSTDVAANGDPIDTYVPISTAFPAGNINDIQYKLSSTEFGGSSDFQIDAANAKVTLDGHLVLGNLGVAPTAVANSVAVYSDAPGAADTGLYVKSTLVQDELVSRTRAIAFGLIF